MLNSERVLRVDAFSNSVRVTIPINRCQRGTCWTGCLALSLSKQERVYIQLIFGKQHYLLIYEADYLINSCIQFSN